MTFSSVPQALERLSEGRMVLVVDAPDRENEGDLVLAAGHATPEAVNFMATHARGLICLPCDGARLDELRIPPMLGATDADQAAFTVSVDHVAAGSGISAADRSLTIRSVVDPSCGPREFRRPGHVFPLRCRPGGVLERPGHTEASVDLVSLAGLPPAAAICEVLNPDGSVARLPQLVAFAARHRIALVSIEELISCRLGAGAAVAHGG